MIIKQFLLIWLDKWFIFYKHTPIMNKKFITLFISGLVMLSVTSASYVPTSRDISNLKNIKNQLDTLVQNNNINLRDFYNQTTVLQGQYSWDERLHYMIWELQSYLYTNLSAQKTAAKAITKLAKKQFLDTYNTGYDAGITLTVDQCSLQYNTIDNLSFAYDFPTALTMAIWYRESNCGFYFPKNWHWPFQIISREYWSWEMNQQLFIETVRDFLEFAKDKISKYNLSWNLTYSDFDYTGIVNFAALYNGWNKSGWLVIPNNPNYVFDWYWSDYTWAKRFWVLPQALKMLERELDNKY